MNMAAAPGTILEWDRTGRGRYVGRVRVPRRRAVQQELEIRVVAAGKLAATRTVPLLPGPVKEIRVEAEDGLFADGQSHELRISLVDRDGNRVEGKDVPRVAAARGSVGELTRHAPGSFRLDYRSRLAADDFDDVVVASVGPVESKTRFRVQARGSALVLGPKVGYTIGKGGLQSPSAGAELGLWLRSFGHGLGLVLEAQYFTFSRTDTIQGVDLDASATFLALEGALAWRRPIAGWMLWLGAGGGAVRASSKLSLTAAQGELSGGSWAPAAHASVGWGRPLGPGTPFLEARAGWFADPRHGPVRGSLQFLTFDLGYRFDAL